MITAEQAVDMANFDWLEAQADSGCTCHLGHPPCSFCVDGFSLSQEEYVNMILEQYGHGVETQDTPSVIDDYDRAMRGIGV